MISTRPATGSRFTVPSGSDAGADRRRGRWLRWLLCAGTALVPAAVLAGDLPTGADVVHGEVAISRPDAATMKIRQGSGKAIVNWGDFSIGRGNSVNIRQPSAQAMMLNRVTGGVPSRVDGSLTANGQVLLVNPSGIAVGPTGRVDTAAFVASTLGITDEDFRAGRLRFSGTGASATVSNAGRIVTGPEGYAALLGGKVKNSGTIRVPMGRIGLGAGERITLDPSGDGFLQVAVPSSDVTDEALIDASGRISADGGMIEIDAATARRTARHAINLSGVVEARTVSGRSGRVTLGGGPGGRVTVSGKVRTTAPKRPDIVVESSPKPAPRPERGGDITITGDRIELRGASLDASGADGGGSVRIGGDYQGGGVLPRASLTAVDAATTIAADALNHGDGGTVIVWSDGLTGFDGQISARGGADGGDGGFAEVSGKTQLAFTGRVDTTAPLGAAGTLLLDPRDVLIDDVDATQGGGWDPGGIFTGGVFFPGAGVSIIDVTDLEGNLATGNVSVTTGFPTDGIAEDGTITVAAAIDWANGSILAFSALGDVVLNQAVNGPNGQFWIDANGTVTTGANGSVNVRLFDLQAGSWLQNPDSAAPLAAFSARDFRIAPDANFLRVEGGSGTGADPYRVFDVYGLQGIKSDLYLNSDFVLAGEIDATGTAFWNGIGDGIFLGFDPIRGLDDEPFEGTLDGDGQTVNGLFIYRPGEDAGLFQAIGPDGAVRSLTLTGLDVTGSDTGGLAASNAGTVESAVASGSVTGIGDAVGGLVGDNSGTVAASAYSGTVRGFRNAVGGLAGSNQGGGTIEDSLADADVTGVHVSTDDGDDAPVFVGGLVGVNDGTLNRVAARGDVSAGNDFGDTSAGGLIGGNSGNVADAYATGDVTADGDVISFTNAGGLIGVTAGGSVARTHATGLVSATGTTTRTGGSVGFAPANIGFEANFWDSVSTQQAESDSSGLDVATPLTTAGMQDQAGFMALAGPLGWNFQTTWAPPEPGHYPAIYTIDPVLYAVPEDIVTDYGTTGTLSFPATIFGGPDVYVFDAPGNALTGEPILGVAGLGRGNVGTYEIVAVSDPAGSDDGTDFRVVSEAAELEVETIALEITANDQTKTYGTGFTFAGDEFTVTAGALANGDTIDRVDLESDGAPAGATVAGSAYPILASNAQGSGLAVDGVANYVITYNNDPAAGGGEFTVEPAPLTIAANDQTKTFGTGLSFTGDEFSITAGRLFNGDTIDAVDLQSEGADADATPSAVPYPILASNAQGSGLAVGGVANYVITYNNDPAAGGGALTVTDPGLRRSFDNDRDARPDVPDFDRENPDTLLPVQYDRDRPAGAAASGGSRELFEARMALDAVKAIVAGFDEAVAACGATQDDIDTYLDCLAQAMEQYAAELDEILDELPDGLQNVSAVIREAKRGVEAAGARARSRLATATTEAEREQIGAEALAEARQAVQQAGSEIRKSITLIRADDPELARVQRQQVTAIAASLDRLDRELVRVSEL